MRAVFFDIGGTLIHGPSGDPWRAVVIPRIRDAFPVCEWAEQVYEADLWKLADPEEPLRQETSIWLKEWMAERGYRLSDEEVERLRRAFAAPMPDSFQTAPGASGLVHWCRERGLKTAALTNLLSRGDEEVRMDCERFDLPIEFVASSYTTGWAKPHRVIFHRALMLVGVRPDETVLIGDDYIADIAGAKRMGLRAIWVPRQGQQPPAGVAETPDAVVASLEDARRIIAGWLASDV